MNSTSFKISPELKKRFIARRAQDLIACRQGLSEQNWKSIETIGHRLKGSAESFSFPELGPIGERLEQAALIEDQQALEQELQLLDEWIQRHAPQSR